VLRLGERSEIELTRLDDQRLVLRVHRGSVALRVAAAELAEEIELVTGEARLAPARAGLYRVDRRLDGERDRTLVHTWRGLLRVDGGPAVKAGERLLLWRDGARLRQEAAGTEPDEFADWVAREDRRDARLDEVWAQGPGAEERLPREMTGAEELAQHGQWDRHPEHGWVWLPARVAPGWAPYRDGRWVWLRPWGWTWVDRAPWGLAPFHYGRWVLWHGRWVWWPGAYVRRPVFSPALVVWSGTPSLSVSVQIGGPGVGWTPLPPRPVVPDTVWRHPVEPVQGPRLPERCVDRRDERRDERHDDRQDLHRQPGPIAPGADRRDDRLDDRPAFRPVPPAAATPAPVAAPVAAPPVSPPAAPPAATPPPARQDRQAAMERLLERQREAARPAPGRRHGAPGSGPGPGRGASPCPPGGRSRGSQEDPRAAGRGAPPAALSAPPPRALSGSHGCGWPGPAAAPSGRRACAPRGASPCPGTATRHTP
jgi:hypothetical protein